jgi:hypothetical protein
MRAILLAVLFLAGCASPIDPETTMTTSVSEAPAPPMLGMAGCSGFHTFFPSPAAGFEGFVPENFTLRQANGMTQVPVFGFICGNGTLEMWALLQVQPPEALRNSTFGLDAVVLQAFTTNETLHGAYLDWGFGDEQVLRASVQVTDFLRSGLVEDARFALGAGSMQYEIRTTVREQGSEFPAESYRYWIVNGTRATGWLEVHSAPSRSFGIGTALFQAQGDDGAPLLAPGIGHRVEDAALALRFERLE